MLPTRRGGRGEQGGRGGRWRLTALTALAAMTACGGESKNPTGPVTGAISIAITGLPAQTAARVTLSGPSGYSHALSASANLPGLPPGTYQVTAQHVNAPGLIYSASVSSANVALLAGESAAVTVTYSGAAAPQLDLVINGTQLLQSAQRSDGSVPMVAGRDALLRVFVTANQANSAQASSPGSPVSPGRPDRLAHGARHRRWRSPGSRYRDLGIQLERGHPRESGEPRFGHRGRTRSDRPDPRGG